MSNIEGWMKARKAETIPLGWKYSKIDWVYGGDFLRKPHGTDNNVVGIKERSYRGYFTWTLLRT